MAYVDPIIKKYFELIRSKNPVIKGYYQGDPFKIPASMMPAVFMNKVETEARALNNAEDEHGIRFRITVVSDVRSEINNDSEVTAGIAELIDILEGRNDADYKLKSSSLMGILRNNIHIDTTKNLRTDLGTITRIDYGSILNRRGQEWFLESSIEFITHFIQVR